MTALAYYLLKMGLCSGVLFLYYHVALRNKLFHHWNRFYLLSAVLLSLALPLLQFNLFPNNDDGLVYAMQSADDYLQAITIKATSPTVTPDQLAFLGYAIVSLFFIGGFVQALLKIRRMLRRHQVQEVRSIRFVNTAEEGTPFSFLRYIFWNKNISLHSETGQRIFQHELVHVQEKHTLDKLFMQVVLCIFWCNPFFWLMRRELRFLHEFIADQKAVGRDGAEALSAMLLHAAYPQHYNQLTNAFFQTSLKRRFRMLTKQSNPRTAYFSRIIALPLMALTVFAFTVRTKPADEAFAAQKKALSVLHDTLPANKKQIASVDVNTNKKLLTIFYTDGSCETLTEKEATDRGLIHNGGYGNLTLVSPQDTKAQSSNVVDVRVKDTGAHPLIVLNGTEVPYKTMQALDPKKIESINVLKGATAAAQYGAKGKNGVILITTKNKPGEAMQLQADSMVIHHSAADENTVKTTAPKPLYIVDGKEWTGDINAIAPSSIASINVLKGDLAQTKYGKKGENGVVEITLKKASDEPSMPRNDNNIVFEQTETPASIDKQEWQAFLEKNLQSLIVNAAKNGAKPGSYTVNIRFLVKKDGSVSDFKALNDPGYGLAKQVLALMPNSPKWNPAEQNGKKVNSYHTQPITFVIQEQ
jgi:TonB-dependent SusC/RagA subfamily outer membrane receptor